MTEDPKEYARSMINMYGEGAEAMARKYVEKHKSWGEKENHAMWMQVVEYITTRRDELKR